MPDADRSSVRPAPAAHRLPSTMQRTRAREFRIPPARPASAVAAEDRRDAGSASSAMPGHGTHTGRGCACALPIPRPAATRWRGKAGPRVIEGSASIRPLPAWGGGVAMGSLRSIPGCIRCAMEAGTSLVIWHVPCFSIDAVPPACYPKPPQTEDLMRPLILLVHSPWPDHRLWPRTGSMRDPNAESPRIVGAEVSRGNSRIRRGGVAGEIPLSRSRLNGRSARRFSSTMIRGSGWRCRSLWNINAALNLPDGHESLHRTTGRLP